jgi:hypothetical protein
VSGISQVPRRSVPCLCLVPGPRPNRRCLASLRSRRCCPRSLHSEDFSVMEISGLPRGFSTCCLRFTSGVATTHVRLASGGRARLYRKGVEPSGSLQKVSDHSSSSSGFILAQEGPSFISRTVTQPPCGPALLVTQGPPLPTCAAHKVVRYPRYCGRVRRVASTAVADPKPS